MPKTLFTIQLRISQQIIDLPVIQSDTQSTLLDRLCDFDSVKNQFRKILNCKIKDSLNYLLNRKNVQRELREKVERFLKGKESEERGEGGKIDEGKEDKQKEKIEVKSQKNESRGECTAKRTSQTYTPIKQRTIQSCLAPQIPVLHLSKQKKLLQIPEVKNNRLTYPSQKPSSSISSSSGHKEIFTAYSTIYGKCKDPELKVMIKKTLDELEQEAPRIYPIRPKNPTRSTPIDSLTQSVTPYQLAQSSTYYHQSPRQDYRPCLSEAKTHQNYEAPTHSIDVKRSNRMLPIYEGRNKSGEREVERERVLNPETKGREEYNSHKKSLTQAVISVRGNDSKSKSRNKRYNYLSQDEITG